MAEDLGTAMPGISVGMDTGRLVLGLADDLRSIEGDLTGLATIPANGRACGSIRRASRPARSLAGMPAAGDGLPVKFGLESGLLPGRGPRRRPGPGGDVGHRLSVRARSTRALLMMERTALELPPAALSGIATLTARFVVEVEGTKAVILDTRKTTPGWRALEKYAVRCGGGTNHRIGLYDAVLIKDNHLAWLESGGDPIGRAVASATPRGPAGSTKFIEVEVDDAGPASTGPWKCRARHHPDRQPRPRGAGRGGPAARCAGPSTSCSKPRAG